MKLTEYNFTFGICVGEGCDKQDGVFYIWGNLQSRFLLSHGRCRGKLGLIHSSNVLNLFYMQGSLVFTQKMGR